MTSSFGSKMAYPRGHLLLAYLCLMPLDASALSFHYDFSNPGDLERAHLLYFHDSSSSGDRIDLTLMAPGSAGRVAYAQPVRLWDSTTGRVASFRTSFTFAIGGNLNNTRGDGMAFFIGTFPPMLPPDSLAGYLGLVSNPDNMGSPPIVAVEFDTVWNDRLDPLNVIADHIGIDVNSIHSTAFTRDLPNLGLVGTMWANISYDASSKMMVVNLRLADRRNIHNIQAPIDFKAAGVPQDAAVGFSAATGTFWESWLSHMDHGALFAREFLYPELCSATNNFAEDRKLGEGSFGEVFSGNLPDPRNPQQVAVKRLKGPLEQTMRDYVTAIMTLGQMNHRNLVKLVGWCDGGQNGRPLLVYELMENKSVEKHLHDESREKTSLPWPERYKIVIGVGRAIEYLHTGCHNLIILHRDIKPSNVMLDATFEPKLGDFGLVKRVYTGQGSPETAMFGTYD
ncbi:hypothetical protein PR202_gb12525 [Eleusine coracana subsp. coracana]|uniref:non-specific serine/threonine protein kinase n=1 Tax=Eleusine coracana subsp. coracana TaxID=191504 RepID=A0AAV5EN32_ELECO|nr:hypothetical protein PR202_gb12525 [Eleusine coracana subsp. coracana]